MQQPEPTRVNHSPELFSARSTQNSGGCTSVRASPFCWVIATLDIFCRGSPQIATCRIAQSTRLESGNEIPTCWLNGGLAVSSQQEIPVLQVPAQRGISSLLENHQEAVNAIFRFQFDGTTGQLRPDNPPRLCPQVQDGRTTTGYVPEKM